MYDDAFLTRLETQLRAALPRWGLASEAPLRLLTISENATFLAEGSAGAPLIFRVNRPHYHTSEEVLSELAWIRSLRAEGVADTPEPLPMTNGELLGGFDDDGQWRNVVAFSFMSGAEPQPGENLPRWFRILGAITARLHEHSRRWKRPQRFARKLWDYEAMVGSRPLWGDWRDGLGLEPDGRAVIERATQVLKVKTAAYGEAPERFGLVHADLRLANLLVDGDRLGVIDFDDCGMSWFMYDFAAAVSFMEHEPFIPELQAAWLEGYRTVAPISAEDEAIMPSLLLLRRILLTAWVATRSETPTAQAMGPAYTDGTVALAERYLVAEG
ncbi:phosphotransferase enzyme family protein [Hansschlegelia quercus]|uniref:Aminoglycoside phosphotransferase n=1 Tax=Hansschlegelia quercus TaxID=2528245 RepID=A0A4Q9GCN4_9HYPH|nr:phosphotransferase [Hansschlegelia quercus]TBN47288.1 aminoglycoside phosphotransferase [Hansschlegelia quercus]